MKEEHKFLKFMLPAKAFAAIKKGTQLWLLECSCGNKQDLWNAGGVRYKACGEPRTIARCPSCKQKTWHKIRKKTELEKQQI